MRLLPRPVLALLLSSLTTTSFEVSFRIDQLNGAVSLGMRTIHSSNPELVEGWQSIVDRVITFWRNNESGAQIGLEVTMI
jgi:hypothetical protein